MDREDEDQWLGVESHLVPRSDPGEKCNGKKVMTIQGPDVENADEWWGNDHLDKEKLVKRIKKHNDLSDVRENENRTYFVGLCKNGAGKGTSHKGEGRCKFHSGSATGGGAPKHNQNGAKSSTQADPHHYTQNLPTDEKDFIEATRATILDRVRKNHGREPDFLDEILASQCANEFHMVSKMTDYSKDELVQVIIHDNSSHEEPGALVEEVRRYSNSLVSKLKDLGVMDDPTSQQADAVQEWKQFLKNGPSPDQDT